ncbi:MAG: hypothetical protein ACLGXA_07980 [Acidobacteriota bacterium]
MTTTNDANAALRALSGKLGKSLSLLREKYGRAGETDAAIVARIQAELGIGHIYVEGAPAPLSDGERMWLRRNLFRVRDDGRLMRGGSRAILLAPHVQGPDTDGFRRGDLLSDDDQRAAVADWIRPSATWTEIRYVAA